MRTWSGVALLDYGEIPQLWHTRLLLAQTNGSSWVILTPDMDMYEEEMSLHNPDLNGFYYAGLAGGIPPHIPAGSVYGFRAMNPLVLGDYMRQGRILADSLRAPAAVVAAPAAGPVAPAAAAVDVADTAMETGGGYAKGSVIVSDPTPLPAGHHLIGDRALIPVAGGAIFAKKMLAAEAARVANDDLRTLPVKFDAEGTRRREFSSAVEKMSGEEPAGGGLQLSGPATCLKMMKAMRDQSFTPITYHEFWLRSGDIPRGDRSIYEHECLSRILEAMACVDQLNLPALQGAELMCRRLQVIREAHRISPSAPDYSAADHFMGWRFRKGQQGVDSDLAAHVANELKAEAAISKEARKAREEANLRRRPNPKSSPKGGGSRGGGGQDQ